MTVIPTIYGSNHKEYKLQDTKTNNFLRKFGAPKEGIENLNKEILELHPKKVLIETVAYVALSILMVGAVITLGATLAPLKILASLCLFNLTHRLVDAAWENYTEENKKYLSVKETIEKINKIFTNEFHYTRHGYTNLDVPLVTFQQYLKPYLESRSIRNEGVNLEGTMSTHYKISGGEIYPWSINPLTLKEVRSKNNSSELGQKYKPWINLLSAIGISKIPSEDKQRIGKIVGYMIHKPCQLETDQKLNQELFNVKHNTDSKTQLFYHSKKDERWIVVRKGNQETTYTEAETLGDFLRKEYNF